MNIPRHSTGSLKLKTYNFASRGRIVKYQPGRTRGNRPKRNPVERSPELHGRIPRPSPCRWTTELKPGSVLIFLNYTLIGQDILGLRLLFIIRGSFFGKFDPGRGILLKCHVIRVFCVGCRAFAISGTPR